MIENIWVEQWVKLKKVKTVYLFHTIIFYHLGDGRQSDNRLGENNTGTQLHIKDESMLDERFSEDNVDLWKEEVAHDTL